jgi:hypothetical protein
MGTKGPHDVILHDLKFIGEKITEVSTRASNF